MYVEHPSFNLPDPTTTIMRYMSYAKFADLLRRRALYFAPVSSLDDKYECTLPQPLATMGLMAGIPDITDEDRPRLEEQFRAFRFQGRQRIRICSWCVSEYESISMWDRYAVTDGLAISSDVGSLMASFSGDDNIYIGMVHYIDYSREFLKMPPDGYFNSFHPSLHKRREYSDEREVRAVVRTPDSSGGDLSISYQAVELEHLLKGVVVSPEAGEWLIELIGVDLEREGINVPVERSFLTRVPPNY